MRCCWSYVPMDPGDPEDKPEECFEEAGEFFNCTIMSGKVCEKHKCRCVPPEDVKQRAKISKEQETLQDNKRNIAIAELLGELAQAIANDDGFDRGDTYRLVAPIVKRAFLAGETWNEKLV